MGLGQHAFQLEHAAGAAAPVDSHMHLGEQRPQVSVLHGLVYRGHGEAIRPGQAARLPRRERQRGRTVRHLGRHMRAVPAVVEPVEVPDGGAPGA